MGQQPAGDAAQRAVAVADPPPALTDWERDLLARLRVLRQSQKRCILVIDGARVFVYRAEPAGTIALP